MFLTFQFHVFRFFLPETAVRRCLFRPAVWVQPFLILIRRQPALVILISVSSCSQVLVSCACEDSHMNIGSKFE